MEFETVMGLEVHTELSTETKIFCSCSTAFGREPNTQVCEICAGMPGALPVLNQKVVEYAIRTGIATHCEITRKNKFDRKNYFYPDLPKAYQTSQLYLPICQNGFIDIEVNGVKKAIRIKEIHMEEDAGKLMHDPLDDCTLIDYNRCGIPLLEIVSEPDFRSSEEVIAYLTKLKAILQYINVSDCKMEQGSLRVDVNLSIRPVGTEAMGTRTEMKNINSFKAIARAIEGERNRQMECIQEGKAIMQETRRWDDTKGTSYAMRSKENARDYRYFPEPDLSSIEIDDMWIETIRKGLPELPEEKKARYLATYGLPVYDVDIITSSKDLVEIFEKALVVCQNPKEVSNWIMVEVLRMTSESNRLPEDITFSPENLGKLILMLDKGIINRNMAKKVFEAMFYENVEPEQYVEEHGLKMINDEEAVLKVVHEVMEANPESIVQWKEGNGKVEKFLMGQCMKRLKGKANPTIVTGLLKKELQQMR